MLTVATILPIIAVLPYLDDRQIRRFIGFTWVVGVFVALMGEIMPSVVELPATAAARRSGSCRWPSPSASPSSCSGSSARA